MAEARGQRTQRAGWTAWTILVGWLTLGVAPAAAKPAGVQIGPIPGWVEPVSFAAEVEPPAQHVSGGIYWLLIDAQDNALIAGREAYAHVVRRIVDEEGVQSGSTVTMSYDPSYERLTVHTILVHRNGRIINKLRPGAIRTLQRETRLEDDIYDGRRTAVVFLEDTRKGDVIEYSFTISGRNPVFGAHYVDAVPLQTDSAVHRFRFRLLWPAGRTLFARSVGVELEPTSRTVDGHVEYRWSRDNVPPVLADEDVPPWYEAYGWIQLSDFRTWGEVADWGADQYASTADATVTTQARALQSADADRGAQVREAVRFVQDEIRYLAMQLGTGSHRPSAPAEVLERRFGDCKDKALLLATLLRAMGVEADVALVDTRRGTHIDALHPSPLAFNHAIVRVRLGEREYWVDPTLRYQGGSLEALSLPDYGRALTLRHDSDALSTIAPHPAGRTDVRHVLTVPEAKQNVATLRIETSYTGADADGFRSGWRAQSQSELEKHSRDYYARVYPTLATAGPMDVRDDPGANVVRTVETYSIPEFWQRDGGLRPTGEVYAVEARSMLPWPDAAERGTPLRVEHPRHVVHVMELHLPADWPITPAAETIENAALRFSHRTSVSGRLVTVRNEIETLADAVEPTHVAGFARDLERINDHLGFALYDDAGSQVPRTLNDVNWPLAISAVLTLILATSAAALFIRRLRRPASEDAGVRPLPIGGWLVLLAIGIAVTPLKIVRDSLELAPMLHAPLWRELTTPGTPAYHALYAPLLTFEVCTNVVLLVGSVLLATLFFQHRRVFRPAYLFFLAFTLAVISADLALSQLVMPDSKADVREIPRAALGLLIWGSYLYRSDRARATFVR